ncbi:MAG: hypothetical protein WB866_04225 [Solirubrobacterales bacterium]
MSERRETLLSERLRDERGRRVVFVSHCLLNENTRYLGGAFHSGAVPEIAELQRLGIGIHQMRCPERQAWGGTVKRLMIPAYGSKGTVLYRFRAPLLRLFVWYTRLVYWRLARAVVRDIQEYQRSGVRVVAIVGVGASPSCGVTTTIDLRRSFEVIASCPVAELNRETFNQRAIVDCRTAGEGLFLRTLARQLARRGITVPLAEYDLVAEMRGAPQTGMRALMSSGAP